MPTAGRMARRAGWVAAAAVAWAFPAPAAQAGDAPAGARERFDGQMVVSVRVGTQRELMTLLAVSEDIWVCGEIRAGDVPARVDAAGRAALEAAGLTVRVVVPDVQALVDEEAARLSKLEGHRERGEDFFADFRRYEDFGPKLAELAAARPDVCTLVTIGTSVLGREISGIVLRGPGGPAGARPAIVINSLQHAREWISGTSTMYTADRLVAAYGSDARATALLDAFEVHVIPIVNPDGYVHTWDVNRMWRKNRREPPEGSGCRGVDLNRNWGVGWGLDSGSSSNPCTDVYRGTEAFSEPETAAVRDYVAGLGTAVAQVDTHTFGRLVLSAWGYTQDAPPDAASFDVVNAVLEGALEGVNGSEFDSGQGSIVLYLSSGAARDHAYGAEDALAWTLEMSTAFVVAPAQIAPNGEELLEATLTLGEWLGANRVIARAPADAPAELPADEPATIAVELLKGMSRPEAGSAVIHWRAGRTGPFGAAPASEGSPGRFEASIGAPLCNSVVQWFVTGTAVDGGVFVFPAAGANGPVSVPVGGGQCPKACLGDWDRNGTVNSTDVSEFINGWFDDLANGTLHADFDANGVVNSTDVSEFINTWFGC